MRDGTFLKNPFVHSHLSIIGLIATLSSQHGAVLSKVSKKLSGAVFGGYYLLLNLIVVVFLDLWKCSRF